MEPTDSPLDHPAINAQATAMFGAGLTNLGADTVLVNPAPAPLAAVGGIALDQFRTPAGTATPARYGGQFAYQRQQLRYIVAVGAGERDRERDALGFRGEVVLGARATPIGGDGSCF